MNNEEYHHLILKTLSSARVFKPQEEFAKKENLSYSNSTYELCLLFQSNERHIFALSGIISHTLVFNSVVKSLLL